MAPPRTASTAHDERCMHLALEEARRGVGLTSPNPPVGAVIVAGEQVIGRGFHRQAGGPHAEVEAIRDAMENHAGLLDGATIYVTLEPCSTHGRTPPCTDAIKAAGISRVVYAATDPNPGHVGKADDILRMAGVEVTSGILEGPCQEIIRPFSKWITTGMPYVIAKAGQSLDGRITRPAGESQWITSDAARAHGRHLRLRADAILVGAETVRQDNPRLTLRDGAEGSAKPQPWRVVLTRSGDLPADCHLLNDEFKDRTLVMKGQDLGDALRTLGRQGVLTVLIEGGGIVLGQAFHQQLVDEVFWYIAPRFCGDGCPCLAGQPWSSSVELQNVTVLPIGDNVLMHGFPHWPDPP